MADRNVIEPTADKFFSLNARYTIDPASTAGELFNDFDCLAGSGMAILSELAAEIAAKDQSEKVFAAYYLLKQAIAAHSKAHSMMFKAGQLDS